MNNKMSPEDVRVTKVETDVNENCIKVDSIYLYNRRQKRLVRNIQTLQVNIIIFSRLTTIILMTNSSTTG